MDLNKWLEDLRSKQDNNEKRTIIHAQLAGIIANISVADAEKLTAFLLADLDVFFAWFQEEAEIELFFSMCEQVPGFQKALFTHAHFGAAFLRRSYRDNSSAFYNFSKKAKHRELLRPLLLPHLDQLCKEPEAFNSFVALTTGNFAGTSVFYLWSKQEEDLEFLDVYINNFLPFSNDEDQIKKLYWALFSCYQKKCDDKINACAGLRLLQTELGRFLLNVFWQFLKGDLPASETINTDWVLQKMQNLRTMQVVDQARAERAEIIRQLQEQGWQLQDVPDDNQCFFYAIRDQMNGLNIPFPVSLEPMQYLYNVAGLAPGAWGGNDHAAIIAETLNCVIVIDDYSEGQYQGSQFYYTNAQQERIVGINLAELPEDKPIVCLLLLKHHFVSVRAHPELVRKHKLLLPQATVATVFEHSVTQNQIQDVEPKVFTEPRKIESLVVESEDADSEQAVGALLASVSEVLWLATGKAAKILEANKSTLLTVEEGGGKTSLLDAAAEGNSELFSSLFIQLVLQKNANFLMERDSHQRTVLHYACADTENAKTILQLLLQFSEILAVFQQILQCLEQNKTLLYTFCKKVPEELQERIFVHEDLSTEVLFATLAKRDLPLLKFMLGCARINLNVYDAKGYSPLAKAINFDFFEAFELLVNCDRVLLVAQMKIDGCTALHYTTAKADPKYAKLLLQKICERDPSLVLLKQALTIRDSNGWDAYPFGLYLRKLNEEVQNGKTLLEIKKYQNLLDAQPVSKQPTSAAKKVNAKPSNIQTHIEIPDTKTLKTQVNTYLQGLKGIDKLVKIIALLRDIQEQSEHNLRFGVAILLQKINEQDKEAGSIAKIIELLQQLQVLLNTKYLSSLQKPERQKELADAIFHFVGMAFGGKKYISQYSDVEELGQIAELLEKIEIHFAGIKIVSSIPNLLSELRQRIEKITLEQNKCAESLIAVSSTMSTGEENRVNDAAIKLAQPVPIEVATEASLLQSKVSENPQSLAEVEPMPAEVQEEAVAKTPLANDSKNPKPLSRKEIKKQWKNNTAENPEQKPILMEANTESAEPVDLADPMGTVPEAPKATTDSAITINETMPFEQEATASKRINPKSLLRQEKKQRRKEAEEAKKATKASGSALKNQAEPMQEASTATVEISSKTETAPISTAIIIGEVSAAVQIQGGQPQQSISVSADSSDKIVPANLVAPISDKVSIDPITIDNTNGLQEHTQLKSILSSKLLSPLSASAKKSIRFNPVVNVKEANETITESLKSESTGLLVKKFRKGIEPQQAKQEETVEKQAGPLQQPQAPIIRILKREGVLPKGSGRGVDFKNSVAQKVSAAESVKPLKPTGQQTQQSIQQNKLITPQVESKGTLADERIALANTSKSANKIASELPEGWQQMNPQDLENLFLRLTPLYQQQMAKSELLIWFNIVTTVLQKVTKVEFIKQNSKNVFAILEGCIESSQDLEGARAVGIIGSLLHVFKVLKESAALLELDIRQQFYQLLLKLQSSALMSKAQGAQGPILQQIITRVADTESGVLPISNNAVPIAQNLELAPGAIRQEATAVIGSTDAAMNTSLLQPSLTDIATAPVLPAEVIIDEMPISVSTPIDSSEFETSLPGVFSFVQLLLAAIAEAGIEKSAAFLVGGRAAQLNRARKLLNSTQQVQDIDLAIFCQKPLNKKTPGECFSLIISKLNELACQGAYSIVNDQFMGGNKAYHFFRFDIKQNRPVEVVIYVADDDPMKQMRSSQEDRDINIRAEMVQLDKTLLKHHYQSDAIDFLQAGTEISERAKVHGCLAVYKYPDADFTPRFRNIMTDWISTLTLASFQESFDRNYDIFRQYFSKVTVEEVYDQLKTLILPILKSEHYFNAELALAALTNPVLKFKSSGSEQALYLLALAAINQRIHGIPMLVILALVNPHSLVKGYYDYVSKRGLEAKIHPDVLCARVEADSTIPSNSLTLHCKAFNTWSVIAVLAVFAEGNKEIQQFISTTIKVEHVAWNYQLFLQRLNETPKGRAETVRTMLERIPEIKSAIMMVEAKASAKLHKEAINEDPNSRTALLLARFHAQDQSSNSAQRNAQNPANSQGALLLSWLRGVKPEAASEANLMHSFKR